MAGRYDRQLVAMFGVLAGAIVVGVMVGKPNPVEAPAVAPPTPQIASEPDDVLVVHVSGEVVSAGLVEVPSEARVADVIAAAGGVTPDADLAGINLAAAVADGQQVVIPSDSASGPATITDQGGESRIRVNQADVAALETLPGVGPVLAGHIVAHRDEYGPFQSVEDLLDVPGIGEQKLASLRDHVIVP